MFRNKNWHKNILLVIMVLTIFTKTYAQKNNYKTQNRNDLETQRVHLLNEIKETQAQLNELQKDKNATVQQLQALQSKLNAREALIQNINNEVNFIDNNITTASNDVKNLSLTLEQQKAQYAQLVRYTYKQRTSQDLMVFLFSSNSFNDAIRRYQYIKQYREYRKQQAEKIAATSNNLQVKIGTLNVQKQQKDIMLKTQQEQQQVLASETQQINMTVSSLKGKEKELIAAINVKRKAAQAVNNAITSAIRKEIESARKKADEERKIAMRAEDAKRKALAQKSADEKRKLKKEQDRARNITSINSKHGNTISNNHNINKTTGKTISGGTRPIILPTIDEPKPVVKAPEPAVNNPRYIGPRERPVITADGSEPALPKTNERIIEKPSSNTPTVYSYKDDLSVETRQLSANFEQNRGNLPWPTAGGYVCEHFGKNKHPVFNKVETENYGFDIRTTKGSTARAIFGGEVSAVFFIPGAGNTVLINHGTYFTAYGKLDKVYVAKGTKINGHQTLGSIMTDADGNTQVHFELYKINGNGALSKINPEQWLRQ